MLLVSLLLSSGQAWADSDQESVQEIDALYAGWRTAVESADIPGYVSVLHKHVRLMPPGADVIEGADAYGAFLEPVFETATYKIEVVEKPRIEVVGEMAFSEYVYTIHLSLKNPDVEVSEPGALTAARTTSRYIDVLRRNDAGQWRVWRHAWQELPQE